MKMKNAAAIIAHTPINPTIEQMCGHFTEIIQQLIILLIKSIPMNTEIPETHSHTEIRTVHDIDQETFNKAALLFKALADPERLKLIAILAEGEACVSELATKGQMSTVSQRLKLLRMENLIKSKRQGKHMIYSLADHHVYELVKNALAHVKEKHKI